MEEAFDPWHHHRTAVELDSGASISAFDRPGGAAAEPPLLLIHGFLDSWRSWTELLQLAGSQTRRVLALTLRGWGDSSKTGPYTVEAYARDVVAVMDQLRLSSVVLVGHSMGTLISTLVAARWPDRVAGLVLCGAGAKLDPEYVVDPSDGTTMREIGLMISEWEDQPDLDFLREFQLGDLGPFVAQGTLSRRFCDQVMAETLKADLRAYKEAWQAMLDEDHTAELAGVRCPAVLVWGTADGVFPRAEQQRLIELLPRARLVPVDGAPHGVIWSHPQAVLDGLAMLATLG